MLSKFLKTNKGNYIPDLYLTRPEIFKDERGYFYEYWNKKSFNAMIGNKVDFVQDNQSSSKKGVLRGIHLQTDPFAQGKLVRVEEGKIFDVAVDLRKDSKTYLKWVGEIDIPE